jgi:ubiquinone/menaquinone biosynthesis C-methylase UbiE
VELRKKIEAELHDKLRDEARSASTHERQHLTSNKKFYFVARASDQYYQQWLRQRCRGKTVLDYCCGNGKVALIAAQSQAKSYGIDISGVSIENCKKEAVTQGLSGSTSFFVMDAENLTFPDDYFDIIVCAGVLHHLDIRKAFLELARVVKASGEIICIEALAHNPLIQHYRVSTPRLRTQWETEHILGKNDIAAAREYFAAISIRFYHLFTLMAVPLWRTSLFNRVLGVLERIDSYVLRLPFVRWWAWQAVFILSKPRKRTHA